MSKRCKRELFKDRRGHYRWRVRGRNGKIVGASSEGFVTAASARRNFDSLYHAMYMAFYETWKAG